MAAGAQTISAASAEVAVSVVIPCHNASEFLADALRSVQNQTLRDFECLIIDDASADDSAAIAMAFVDADPRFKLLSLTENKGASAARNAGLAQACGEWIALLDADDLYVPARLETLARIGEEEQAELVIDDQIVTEFPALRSAHRAFGFRDAKRPFTEEDFYRGTRLFRRSLSTGYMKPLIRREFLRRSQVAYDTSVLSGEDFLFYAHLLARRPRAVATNFAGYVYRRIRGSLSRSDTHMHLHAELGARVLGELGHQLSPQSRDALLARGRELQQITRALPALRAFRERRWSGVAQSLIKEPRAVLTGMRLARMHVVRSSAALTGSRRASDSRPPPAASSVQAPSPTDSSPVGLVLAERAFRTRDTNPYQYLLYSQVARLGPRVEEFLYPWNWVGARPQIVHLHWPEMPLGHPSPLRARVQLQLLLNGLRVCKARGARVIWTVHNLDAHEAAERLNPFRERLRRSLWRAMRSALDGWIVHSEDSRAEALIVHPWLADLPFTIIPHGHFRGEYPDEVTRSEARARLGFQPNERVLLCFGAVRPYRNVPALLKAFRATPGEDMRLVIAGGVRGAALQAEIEALAEQDSRVRLDLRHVPSDELQYNFRASDLVVLPYRDILNSGAALLALSFNRPVLLPDMGSMPELQRNVGVDWVHLFQGEISPTDLKQAVAWSASASRPDRARLSGLDWSHLARLTLNFYLRVIGGEAATPSPRQ